MRHARLIAILLLGLAPSLLGAGEVRAVVDVDTILDRVRDATRYHHERDFGGVLVGETSDPTNGNSSPVRVEFDSTGAYSWLDVNQGKRFGYDGLFGWVETDGLLVERIRDDSHDPTRLEMWFRTGYWLSPGAPIDFELLARDPTSTTLRASLRDGRATATLVIAEPSALLRDVTLTHSDDPLSSEHSTRLLIAGYGDDRGFRYARSLHRTRPDGTRVLERYSRREELPTHFGNRFEGGEPPLAPARFDKKSKGIVVAKSPTGHLLIRPSINGHQVGWFLFDTGSAATVVDIGVAERLELVRGGKTSVRGIAGELDAEYASGESFRVGSVELDEPTLTVVALKNLRRAFGRPIEGLIGWEFLTRCIVEVDAKRGKIAAHDPNDETYLASLPSNLDWLPISLAGRHATVQTTVAGIRLRCIVDTGSDSGLAIRRGIPAFDRLIAPLRTKKSNVSGAATRFRGEVLHIGPLQIGARVVPEIDALIYDELDDTLIRRYSEGLIGLPALSGAILILDYPHRRMALMEPSAR